MVGLYKRRKLQKMRDKRRNQRIATLLWGLSNIKNSSKNTIKFSEILRKKKGLMEENVKKKKERKMKEDMLKN